MSDEPGVEPQAGCRHVFVSSTEWVDALRRFAPSLGLSVDMADRLGHRCQAELREAKGLHEIATESWPPRKPTNG